MAYIKKNSVQKEAHIQQELEYLFFFDHVEFICKAPAKIYFFDLKYLHFLYKCVQARSATLHNSPSFH